jgi:hypothetical protein
MTFTGIIIGGATFLTIGAFHPIVIKAEYHWGAGCWWLFLLAGAACIAGSLFANGLWAILLGVVGFSCLWSIHELLRQRVRVDKGWFPEGPGHRSYKKVKKGQEKEPCNG